MSLFMLRRLALAAVLMLCAAGSALAQSTTVIVVRHAERVDDSADALLSDAGIARANALADRLADAGVTAIITTQYQRTRMTAAPLAERMGLTPIVVGASGVDHAAIVAAAVREHGNGGVVLVVGHSNTLPPIISALGGPDVGYIPGTDYDNLFVLTLTGDEVRLVRARF